MLGISPEIAGASSSAAGSSGESKDSHAHRRGPKPRSWKDKSKSKEKEKAASEKKEASVKKEVKDKKPAFLQQTASGRTPKVASRYAELSKQALIYAPVYGVICEINLPVPAL